MAPGLLSPAAVSHHHLNPSILTATNPFVPSIHFFSLYNYSSSKIISSHCRNSKYWCDRCRARIPHPPSTLESEPPPDDDQRLNSGSISSFSRFQESVQIFCAVFFWMSLFFWSSIWDERNKGRSI